MGWCVCMSMYVCACVQQQRRQSEFTRLHTAQKVVWKKSEAKENEEGRKSGDIRREKKTEKKRQREREGEYKQSCIISTGSGYRKNEKTTGRVIYSKKLMVLHRMFISNKFFSRSLIWYQSRKRRNTCEIFSWKVSQKMRVYFIYIYFCHIWRIRQINTEKRRKKKKYRKYE